MPNGSGNGRALAPLMVLATVAASAASETIPPSMAACATCHGAVVKRYLGHGMARSIGSAGEVTRGAVTNPISKNRYEIAADRDGPTLTTTLPDGGTRRQRVVGRIGAGVLDTSWVTAEVDGATGEVSGRLFFAPVETVTGHGLELAPFELHPGSLGPDLALTRNCLTCHTADDLDSPAPFPSNHLGADAFNRLSPLTCDACHGDVQSHADIVSGRREAPEGDIGVTRLGRLPPGAQRDVCARCHLQGEARIDLVKGKPRRDQALAGQIPVLVPQRTIDDFRFVGQLERLALSECFKASPAMTCTTCHQPHSSVAAQGTASFDAACGKCHPLPASHGSPAPPQTAARRAGCVDCHVRRSQPFDLPHVRAADHLIRRRIAPPRDDLPHRSFADRDGELALFDDGRLASALETREGRLWLSGVRSMALVSLGRFDDAARLFDGFPPPGSPAARQPSAPPASALVPLETEASFHALRASVLAATGRFDAAKAAFSDALALDPRLAGARLGRARLLLDTGDPAGALVETQAVIEVHPAAEQPWDLRVEIAERAGRRDLVLAALKASARRWPSNAGTWLRLGLLLRQQGDAEGARQALERARALRPSLVSPPKP
jgi:hypothetical protein